MNASAASLFEPLSNNTLRGRIAEKLRDAMLSGTLKEGERIIERRLAEQFATSLTAVREALIELETEGLVLKKPNASTYVRKLTRDAAEKIFAVRGVLEALAVEEAARRAGPAHVQELERIYLDLVDAARGKNPRQFIETDFALHQRIWHISDNECLEMTLRRVTLPVFGNTAVRIITRHPIDLVYDAQLHAPILEAIKAGDPVAARTALTCATQLWLTQVRSAIPED